MKLFNKLLNHEAKMAVVGLGYVGMPIAVEFAKHIDVIGFDIDSRKIAVYLKGTDPTREVGNETVRDSNVEWTDDETRLSEAKFIIIAVPTPINENTTPDLSLIIGASEIVGRNLTKGSIVVYESTVYPGVTEEICLPILKKESGLKCGDDFKIGYSPERINPGDRVHRLTTIKKIVSSIDDDSLEEISNIYSIVAKAGIHKAPCIKVAEAAKVIENCQRDINIALMNELSVIFNKMEIDTLEVIEAAETKWNFLPFRPGLVGGHCIGIDPYYLTYCAEQFGYHSQVILSGRRINDSMSKYVAEQTIKQMIKADKNIKNAKVGVLGITFKENCPDIRNTKVNDILKELREYGISHIVCDPVADASETRKFYGVELVNISEFKDLDCLIIAVAHNEFKNLTIDNLNGMFKNQKILIDVKGVKNKKEMLDAGYIYWRL